MSITMATPSLTDEKVSIRNYPSFENVFEGSDHILKKNFDLRIQKSILEKIIFELAEHNQFNFEVNNKDYKPELLVKVRRHIHNGRDILEISLFVLDYYYDDDCLDMTTVEKLQKHFWVKTSDISSILNK